MLFAITVHLREDDILPYKIKTTHIQTMEKLKISRAVIVEGRYDKIKLDSIIDALIIPTDGFGVFRSDEKKLLLTRLAGERGLIVLTDSDGAGLVIRNYMNSIIPKEQLTHLFIPKIYGKERRKSVASKEGTLGVEGMSAALLRELFEPFAVDADTQITTDPISKTDLFCDGFSGGDASKKRRIALQKALGLPENISANALLAAINMLGGRNIYEKAKKDVENL